MSRDSAKCRRIVVRSQAFEGPGGRLLLKCHAGGEIIDVLKDAKKWRADHIVRYAEGGEDTAENLRPICTDCDAIKAPDDTREVAHGKRYGDKHLGVITKQGWGKGWHK